MNGTTHPNRTTTLRLSTVALSVILLTATAACSTENKGPQVSQTSGSHSNSSESGLPSQGSGSERTTPSGGAVSSTPSATPGSTAASTSDPSPAATALTWKTYTDPAKKVSFELPENWIAQSVTAEAGSLPGALKVEVKDGGGRYIATLQTGLPPAGPIACPAGQSHPYIVISSAPLDVPHSDGPDTIDPRVVFRVIQGYKFFGSFGITNMVAGADGQACELRNRVQGPSGKGDYSFGDVTAVHAFAADEKVAPAKTFDTLDLAAKYVAHDSEFANVQRMLLSLKVNL